MCRRAGAAARHDLDRREYLERGNERRNNQEERRRREERDGDFEELGHFPRAVDVRRLIDVLGQRRDRRGVDHHRVAHARPDRHQHDRRQRPVMIAQPLRRILHTQHLDHLGKRSPRGIHHHPHDGDRHHVRDVGHEHRQPNRQLSVAELVDDHSQYQRQEDRHRHHAGSEDDGVDQRIDEPLVRPHLHIIGAAIEDPVAKTLRIVPVGKADDQRYDHRHQRKQGKAQHIGRDKGVAGQIRLELSADAPFP